MSATIELGATNRFKSTNSAAVEVFPGVKRTPGVCDGDACVRDSHIAIYDLFEWRQLGCSDTEILEHYPGLTQADLDHAWEYAKLHEEEIEQLIEDHYFDKSSERKSVEVMPGINRTKGLLGGSPCIGNWRIPVFLLVEMKKDLSDTDLLDCYPGVTQADLDHAWEYARRHAQEIQQEIDENNRDDDE